LTKEQNPITVTSFNKYLAVVEFKI